MATYKYYSGNLTTDTVINAQNDLDAAVMGGYVLNDSGNKSINVAFTFDGINYGDAIQIQAGEEFRLEAFPAFQQMKLVWNANAAYRIVLGTFIQKVK